MGEIFERGPDIYHMECDICGKKEDIVNKNPYRVPWWCHRRWSRLTYEFARKSPWGAPNKAACGIVLCPECNKKLRKLIKNVDLPEEE